MREPSFPSGQQGRPGQTDRSGIGPQPMARTAIVHRAGGTPRPVAAPENARILRQALSEDGQDGQADLWMPHQPAVRQRVGPTIKALRLRREMSLHQLADAAGVSPSHLSRIERGLTVPSYEVLDRIADSLGSDLRQLRNEEERARAVDGELDQLFDYFDMPTPTRAELLQLSNRARADIARALHRAIRRSA